MINPRIVQRVDEILDGQVSQLYKEQPLAQDWARVTKVIEEAGESVNELILSTGQNPRKGFDPGARERLLKELADTALTAVYAIQHFTKDVSLTELLLRQAQDKHIIRLVQVGDADGEGVAQ